MSCLDENTLLALGEGDLSEEECARVYEHLDTCPACWRVMGGVARLEEEGSEAAFVGLKPGLVVGRYVVGRWLGSGNFGNVYAGHDPKLQREVALKVLHAEAETARGMLEEEARALARLRHPNVLTVHELIEEPPHTVLVTELIDGISFREWVATQRPSEAMVADRVLEAARGVAAIHRAGLLHRDLKPDNLFVTTDGHAIVADFGFAAARERRPADIAGTPAYMAPEALAGGVVDQRSDLYSLCAVLRECLAATPRGRASAPLWRVLERGLHRDPRRRFVDVEALIAAIEAARRVPVRRRRLQTVTLGLLMGSTALFVLTREEPCEENERLDTTTLRELVTLRQGEAPSRLEQRQWETAHDRLAAMEERWGQSRAAICESRDPVVRTELGTGCLELHRRQIQALQAGVEAQTIVAGEQLLQEIAGVGSAEDCVALAFGGGHDGTAASHEDVVAIRRLWVRAQQLLMEERIAEATAEAERALELARATGDEALVLEAAVALGIARVHAEPEAGARQLREAVQTAEVAGMVRLQARALRGSADALRIAGDFESARREAERALSLVEQLRDGDELRASIHNLLCNLANRQGDYPLALQHCAQAVEAYASIGDLKTAAARFNIGTILLSLERWEEAHTVFETAIAELTRDYGPRHPFTGRAWHSVGASRSKLGRFEAALEAYERAHAILRETLGDEHRDTRSAIFGRANVLYEQGRIDEALVVYQRCIEWETSDAGQPSLRVYCLEAAGRSLVDLGREREALEMMRRAYADGEHQLPEKTALWAAIAYGLAKLEYTHGDRQAAIAYARAAEASCTAGQWDAAPELRAEVSKWLAQRA